MLMPQVINSPKTTFQWDHGKRYGEGARQEQPDLFRVVEDEFEPSLWR